MSTGGLIARATALLPGAETPPVTTPREPAREAAERELSKPMYHENDPSLIDRALRAFFDWLDDLFGAAAGATPGGAVGLLAVVLVIALSATALWWRLGAPRRTATTAPALFPDGIRSAADHRTAAEAHAAAGRWNEAVQERMRAIVRSLEERTLLDPRPGRTADEAATEAAQSLPSQAQALHAAARTFDDITYGGRPAAPTTYATFRTLDDSLSHTRPSLPTPTP
ncbi:DUF4129 domain-containing protein [Streptomyces sp. NPDC047014]|uniref:DUF4129 domain-containing protein n=1 Tax=Streptomyces sp. NPDC047014 TaxID=3155736 RepID=UPI0033D7A39B